MKNLAQCQLQTAEITEWKEITSAVKEQKELRHHQEEEETHTEDSAPEAQNSRDD